jgi:uncharacterized membrane protein
MLMWPKRDSRRPIRNATHSLSEGGRIGYGRGTAQIAVYSVHNHRRTVRKSVRKSSTNTIAASCIGTIAFATATNTTKSDIQTPADTIAPSHQVRRKTFF